MKRLNSLIGAGVLGLMTVPFVGGCDTKDDGDDIVADDDLQDDGVEDEDPSGEPQPDAGGGEPMPEEMFEACEAQGTERACGDGDTGVQYCDWLSAADDLAWGECIVYPECTPGESEECFPGEETFEGLTQGCYLVEGEPQWDYEACNTPLVLSFDRTAVEFAASTHTFDISGAGQCIDTDWPTAATPWLAIDLDRSGTIDGGHELFGTGTVLASGRHAQNGFVALQSLDTDGDKVITPRDELFSELVLWSDHDGDRRSTLWELEPLSAHGIVSIPLAYTDVRQCDARGNCARQRATVELAAGRHQTAEVIDVHMACQ